MSVETNVLKTGPDQQGTSLFICGLIPIIMKCA